MKITILSDMHLGFAKGTEREWDSYEALAEALEKSRDSDLILIAGDMFDSNNPPAEVLALAEEVLLPSLLRDGDARIAEGIGRGVKNNMVNPEGVPIIAIHGTHERRAKGLLNPVQALEKAGFLVYLHCNGVVVEKRKGQQLEPESLTAKTNGEKPSPERICIMGMSGVPDQYAAAVLEEWNPKPQEGCYNILMIHQNLKGFMHEKVPNQLDPGRLNRGFDLYVCGHIHDAREAKLGDSRVIIPGGMVATQLRGEGDNSLGFYRIDTGTGRGEFVRLESQRRVYFVEAGSREEADKRIREILQEKHEKKPIIRLKVRGDFPARELKIRLVDRAILILKREPEKGEESAAVGLEEQRLSVGELGKKLLRENLERQGLRPDVFENVFELLLEKRTEKALELLRKGEEAAGVKRKKRPEGKDSGKWKGKGELGRFLG